jgi:hypothetical protein
MRPHGGAARGPGRVDTRTGAAAGLRLRAARGRPGARSTIDRPSGRRRGQALAGAPLQAAQARCARRSGSESARPAAPLRFPRPCPRGKGTPSPTRRGARRRGARATPARPRASGRARRRTSRMGPLPRTRRPGHGGPLGQLRRSARRPPEGERSCRFRALRPVRRRGMPHPCSAPPRGRSPRAQTRVRRAHRSLSGVGSARCPSAVHATSSPPRRKAPKR